MRGLATELRVTIRGLVKRPGYALFALATIVLGAGAMTAGYGLLHHVVLRPLPFEKPERLLAIRTLYGSGTLGLTQAEYLHLADHPGPFREIAALVDPSLDRDWIWTGPDGREILEAVRVTPGFFSALGVAPALGPGPDAAAPGAPQLVVSHGFWRARLGGDPAAVGRTLEINGSPYALVGVLPREFEFPIRPDPLEAWIAFSPEAAAPLPEAPLSFRVVGRLATGETVERARRVTTRTVTEFRAGIPGEDPGGVSVRPLAEDLLGPARRPVALLATGGLLVLLVASLNLSLLVAARNAERRGELRVRTALGASRGRLLRQLLLEAGLLAAVGGAGAALLGGAVLGWLLEARPGEMVRTGAGEVGPEVLVFGLVAALLPALVAAALPGLRISANVRELSARGSTAGASGRRFASALTAVESGVVFCLLVVAALVVLSLRKVTTVDPGFDTVSTVALQVHLPDDRYGGGDGETARFLLEVEDRVRALPGVTAAGAITHLPLSEESWSGSFRIEGRDDMGPGDRPVVDWELVGPGYFEAAGIPVLRGRTFDARDRGDAPRVAIVNETLARRWWPDGEPLGARISGGGAWSTVVGVVGDVKQQGLARDTRGFMYLPAIQSFPGLEYQLVVRAGGGEPAAVVPRVRDLLRELAPGATVAEVRTLRELVRSSSASFRMRAVLLGGFAFLALLLGMAGIYGVAAHGVRTRRREIGIRMAVGADARRVVAGVLRDGLAPVVGGMLGGLALVLAGAPALRGLLFGVGATDPGAVATIALLVLASAAAAVLPPALRARRTDPVRMLREE